MINIEVDPKVINTMLQEAIDDRVDKIARQKYFLTYSELSQYLNISKPIIEDRLIKNGLKYYKVGSKYLFKKEEVDMFLDELTQSMTATNNDLKFYQRIQQEVSNY
ncbi:hypothetical protein GCM10011351_27060 [Paraliobacillus quinghaiensis]|uniref:Helix-turn-helix domain-containing protein n=1 Tax=Paraliobacillus quinghaiensis TaxID=470815 RepID=A0A917TVK9_9BACI|nr:hypothetical protein GCM10011351_27060 [Paraliobacillus quinghaiensis]